MAATAAPLPDIGSSAAGGPSPPPVLAAPPPLPRSAVATPRRPQGSANAGSEAAAITELLKALRRLRAGESVDPLVIEKLTAQGDAGGAAGAGSLAGACARVIAWWEERLERRRRSAEGQPIGVDPAYQPDADATAGISVERQQLLAQATFLENKVAKLREKLKRKNAEAEAEGGAAAEAMAEEEAAKRAEMLAELEKLRVEVARLQDASGQDLTAELEALRNQVGEAQEEVARMVSEKEAAENAAKLARRLLVNMENRLQDVVRSRESEQMDLMEEQRKLQRRLEQQNTQLTALDRIRGQQRQQEAMRETLRESQQELKALKEEEEEYLRKQREMEDRAAELAEQLEDQLAAQAAEALRLREEYARAAREKADVERVLQEKSQELNNLGDVSETRERELRDEIAKVRADSEAMLKSMEDEHAEKLGKLDEDHGDVVRQVSEAASRDAAESAAKFAAESAELKRQHVKDLEALRERGRAEEMALATRTAAVEAELANLKVDAECARREREFRGTVWLCARREAYDKEVLLATISDILDFRGISRIRIVDTDAVVDVQAPTLNAQACEDSSSAVLRGLLQDALRSDGAREADVQLAAAAPEAPLPLAEGPSAESPTSGMKTRILEISPPSGAPLRTSRPLRARSKRDAPSGVRDPDWRLHSGSSPTSQPSTQRSKLALPESVVEEASPEAEPEDVPALLATRDLASPVGTLANAQDLHSVTLAVSETTAAGETHWIRLELLEDPTAPDPAVSSTDAADRLLDAVARGDARLETLAILSASSARGEVQLGTPWPGETAGLFERRVQQIRGWQLVLTAFLNVDPFVLKFVAFDGVAGNEFTLYLLRDDVEAVAPGATALQPKEMIEAVVPSLHVIVRDGTLLLVCIQEVAALPNCYNRIDPSLCEMTELSADYRRERRRLVQPMLNAAGGTSDETLMLAAQGIKTASLTSLVLPAKWEKMREELLHIEDRFIFLIVEHDLQFEDQHHVKLTLQEAGHCKPFCLELVLDRQTRQQRVLAQYCELEGLLLMLVVEEIVTPAVLVVRVLSARSGEEQLFDIAFWVSDWSIADVASLAQVPPQKRTQLLEFLMQWPAGARVIAESTTAALSLTGGTRMEVGPCFTCYAPKPVILDAAKLSFQRALEWKLIASGGRKLRRACDALYIIRVYYRADPYSQFAVTAFHIDTCEEWELLLSVEDAAARLPTVLRDCRARGLDAAAASGDSIYMNALAAGLVSKCCFANVSGVFVLVPPREGSDASGAAEGVRVLLSSQPAAGQTQTDGVGAHPALPHPVDLEASGGKGTDESSGETAIVPFASATNPQTSQDVVLERTCCEATVLGSTGNWAVASCAGTLLSGGRFIDLRSHGAAGNVEELAETVHTAMERLGSLSLVISLDAVSGGHRLSVYHPDTCTLLELAMPTRDCSCPEKSCATLAKIDGHKVVISLAEFSFPHRLQVLIREAGGNDFRCSLQSDEVYVLVPRAQREFLSACVDDLLRNGAINGADGICFEERSARGTCSLSEGVVTVVRAPIRLSDLRGDGSPRDKSIEAIDDNRSDEPPAVLLCSAAFAIGSRHFRISIARPQSSDALTLGIADASDASNAHLLHLSASAGPTIRSEFREISGSRLLLLALVDAAPKALRVAIVDPESKCNFQLLLLDSPEEEPLPPLQDLDADRLSLAGALRSLGMAVAPEDAVTIAVPHASSFPRAVTNESTGSMAASSAAEEVGAAAAGGRRQQVVMHRSMTKLLSGQPVMVTIVREALGDYEVRFRVLIYHPITSKETVLPLMSPLLEKVLGECGLGNSLFISADAVDRKHKELAAAIMPLIYVHPDGMEIELRAAPKHGGKTGAQKSPSPMPLAA